NAFAPGKERVFFILDATWPCAKKMIKLSTNLHKLPFVSFENTQKSNFSIKQQPHELCLSTIESVKKVIEDLNELGLEKTKTQNFLRPFEKMVEYQIECILNPNNKNHDSSKEGVVRKKEFYKTNAQRALFYEKENFDS
ncbi:MAG: DTW domain-containing protein, partial [Bacteriovoracaceae bacterium]|nr:DTW domain-containing protein [Bacteriovoracaceae bacterium]